MIRIIADTAADLTKDDLERYHIEVIQEPVTFDGDNEPTISLDEFWSKLLDDRIARTSQPSPQVFYDLFEEAKRNQDTLICIVISSKLSSTYESASFIKQSVGYENIYIVDSLLASVAERFFVLEAAKLRDQNKSAQEIIQELEKFRSKIRLYACVDTLKYLARGGRISKTMADLGNLINIKPLITISPDGTLVPCAKTIGIHRAIVKMIEKIKKERIDPSYELIPIYSYDSKNCEQFIHKAIRNHLDIKLENITPIGSTIGAHFGPFGFGIVYISY